MASSSSDPSSSSRWSGSVRGRAAGAEVEANDSGMTVQPGNRCAYLAGTGGSAASVEDSQMRAFGAQLTGNRVAHGSLGQGSPAGPAE